MNLKPETIEALSHFVDRLHERGLDAIADNITELLEELTEQKPTPKRKKP